MVHVGILPFNNTLSLRKWLAVSLTSAAIVIGLVGWLGVLFDVPLLLSWTQYGNPTTPQSLAVLVILALVFLIFNLLPPAKQNHYLRAALLCYGAIIGLCLYEMAEFLMASPDTTAWEFYLPHSVREGHMAFFSAFGFLLISISLLLRTLQSEKHRDWMEFVIPAFSLLTLNLGAFGILENLTQRQAFVYFISFSTSVGLFFLGLASLVDWQRPFFLTRPFFTYSSARLYTWLLVLVWGFFVVWQALFNNTASFLMSTPLTQTIRIWDEQLEVVMSTLILGLGLYLLAMLDEANMIRQQLETSTQKLKGAFDSMTILAATLSHDLKAPLQTGIDALEMVQTGHFGTDIHTPRLQRILETLTGNNQFALDLVVNLVDLLRLEGSGETFEPQPIQIEHFLHARLEELMPVALRKDIALTLSLGDTPLPPVAGDANSLKRLMHNLVYNALQWAPTGGHVTVTASIRQAEHKRPAMLMVTVADDGPGISPEQAKRLFSKFNENPNAPASSGLGLYIAKRVVERHGGEIWASPAPTGTGTVLGFTVPMQAASKRHKPASSKAAAASPFSHHRPQQPDSSPTAEHPTSGNA